MRPTRYRAAATFTAGLISTALLAAGTLRAQSATPAADTWTKELAAYNIAWTTRSGNSAGSMPLSGGVLGLNVWVENDEVCFLMGSPNCLDENGMQVKLGLVRLRFPAGAFDNSFKQELHLARSEIVITGKTASGAPLSVKLWCGVEHPVIHAETSAGDPVDITATYETWTNYAASPVADGLRWSRRLAEVNARRQHDLKSQGMSEFADRVPDPLSGLTCGGMMSAPGLVDAGTGAAKFNGLATRTRSLKTAAPVRRLDLTLTLRMEQDKSLSAWENNLAADAARARQNAAADRAAALARWGAFWDRSHIAVNPGAGEPDTAWVAGRNYQLIRYMYGANSRGRAMTLFNGGSFPCTKNPDKRAWDETQFMAQNQRLSYWPMLRSGDFDILKVATDFYRDRTAMSRLHAQKFWGVDGVAWPEAFNIFGLAALGTTPDGRCNPSHLEHHFTSGMEFALMMLEIGRYTGKDFPGYLDAPLGILRYYDGIHQKNLTKKTGKPLDAAGHLVIHPSDACEPYHGCTNNTDVVAGLRALSRALLALPPGKLTAQDRAYVEGFQSRIPPFPLREKNGRAYYAAAESWDWVMQNQNMDFPQMYVCFPFGELFLGRSDMSLAKNTFDLSPINNRVQQQNHAWYQTVINFARMGDTASAQNYLLGKMHHASERFPTFYTTFYIDGRPDFNHTPDMDHCGTAMLGLQEMLMQTDGKRILLGAAWPKAWSAHFKLHAPFSTTVAGRVVDGKVVVDTVTPEPRRADIEIFPLKESPPVPLTTGKPAKASDVFNHHHTAAKAFDNDPGTRWATKSGKQAWLEVDLGAPAVVARAVIDETSYPRVTRFALEAKQADGTWKPLVEGDTLGADKELKFAPAQARVFRLNILDCKEDGPTIDEVRLFAK